MQQRQQAHPRPVAGGLTVPQRAQRLGVSPQWLSDRRANGWMPLAKAPTTGLSLFPDQPTTVEPLQPLQAGRRMQGDFRAPAVDIYSELTP